jgi:magnesium transporter
MIRSTAKIFKKALYSTFSHTPKRNYQKAAGLAPGAAVFVGQQKLDSVYAQVIAYNQDEFYITETDNPIETINQTPEKLLVWVNIAGLHDIKFMESLQAHFDFDPLMVEDLLDTHQRPKYEHFEKWNMVVGRMLKVSSNEGLFESEQISIVFNDRILFTFQEVKEDVFDSLRDRLKRANGRIRKRSIDYLAYAIMDSMVDYYIIVVEGFGEGIDNLDNKLLSGRADKGIIEKITYFKREINYLRKVIRPFREATIQLDKSDVIAEENMVFLKDLLDHTNQAIESIELYRELISDQMNLYHSNSSNKLNDIMRILTIISVIFIPMTFIAGVYGMNFEHFPELDNPYAYPIFWTVEIVLAATMLILFKRKRWL